MRRVYIVITTTLTLSLFVVLNGKSERQLINVPMDVIAQQQIAFADDKNQEQLITQLTPAEEQDLQIFLPQALRWAIKWVQPTNCLESGKIVAFDFAEAIKRHQGESVEMQMYISESSLTVSFDSLRLYLTFSRLHGLGLGPPQVDRFCESTYQEHTIINEQYRAARSEAIKGNPELIAKMEEYKKRSPDSQSKRQLMRQEIRGFLIESLVEEPVQEPAAWSNEKKRLYKMVIQIAKEEANLGCEQGATVTVTIPDFNLGDPEVFALIKDAYYKTEGLRGLLVGFNRDQTSGEYTAESIKTFGLPDEMKPLVPRIMKRRVEEIKLPCR